MLPLRRRCERGLRVDEAPPERRVVVRDTEVGGVPLDDRLDLIRRELRPANSIGSAAYVVPPIVAKASRPSVTGNDDRLSTPGATTSSCAPVFENEASWFFESTAPTVRTLWYPPPRPAAA
jgi:hypothetical protein